MSFQYRFGYPTDEMGARQPTIIPLEASFGLPPQPTEQRLPVPEPSRVQISPDTSDLLNRMAPEYRGRFLEDVRQGRLPLTTEGINQFISWQTPIAGGVKISASFGEPIPLGYGEGKGKGFGEPLGLGYGEGKGVGEATRLSSQYQTGTLQPSRLGDRPVRAIVEMGTQEATAAVKREMAQAHEQGRNPSFRIVGSRLTVGQEAIDEGRLSGRGGLSGMTPGTVSGIGYGAGKVEDVMSMGREYPSSMNKQISPTTQPAETTQSVAMDAVKRWNMLDPFEVISRARAKGFSQQAIEKALMESKVARGQYPKWAFDFITGTETEKVKAESKAAAEAKYREPEKVTPDDMYVSALVRLGRNEPLNPGELEILQSKGKGKEKGKEKDELLDKAITIVTSDKMGISKLPTEEIVGRIMKTKSALQAGIIPTSVLVNDLTKSGAAFIARTVQSEKDLSWEDAIKYGANLSDGEIMRYLGKDADKYLISKGGK